MSKGQKTTKKKKPKKLRIFDFDDTLVQTKGTVDLVKVDGTRIVMTPAEFAVYDKLPGERFDFTKFEETLVEPAEVKWVTKILRRVVKKHGQDGAMVLTARSKDAPVLRFFRMFNLPAIPVVCLNSADPQKKADHVYLVAIEDEYDVIEFFDDSIKNINAVKELSGKLPHIKFIVRHIRHVRLEEIDVT